MKESRVAKFEKGIKKEEIKLEQELKKEGKGISWFFRSHTFKILLAILVFIVLISAIIYLAATQGRVYIEKSVINAPIIILSPTSPGVLDKVFVKEGDFVPANTIVAEVNNVPIKSKVDGLVIFVQNTPGQSVSAQTPIVEMIDPIELRVIGHIQEDKGLSKIKPGQKVIFTVDAFGSKQYEGIVDSVSPTSRSSDIVFSISDKRQENEFDIKVKFSADYPELMNGMSAKMWVYQ